MVEDYLKDSRYSCSEMERRARAYYMYAHELGKI